MKKRKDIAIRPPAHVHELVQRAGRENVFWASARRPGRVPEPGNGVDEMTNAVVGSPVTATQGTPSDQPVWQGNRYQLAGDDFLTLSPTGWAFEGLTYVGVRRLSAGLSGAAYYLFNASSSSTDFDIFFRYDANNQRYEPEVFDDGGGFAGVTSGAEDQGDQIGSTVAVGMSVDADGAFEIATSTGISVTQSAPGGSLDAVDDLVIGARRPSSPMQHWDGYTLAETIVRGYSEDDLSGLVTAAAQHWRIV